MNGADDSVIAVAVELNVPGAGRIWVPPRGRPYWVSAPGRAGPDLTDEEIERYLPGWAGPCPPGDATARDSP